MVRQAECEDPALNSSSDPFILYAENSEEAALYKRMARVGGKVGVVGGIGGSSIRAPSNHNHFFTAHFRSVPLKDFRRADLYLYEKMGR